MFKKLQTEHREWSIKNFGEQEVEDFQLGLIEEVGELAHSVLKRKQGIRNTEGHDLLIRDAVGDITLYLIGLASCLDVSLNDYNRDYYIHEDMFTVKNISSRINHVLNSPLPTISYYENSIYSVFYVLSGFSGKEGFDYEQTVKETWANVKKRDWVNDPDAVEHDRSTLK